MWDSEKNVARDITIFPEKNIQRTIAHLSAEDMLKSAVSEEKKFKHIESVWFRTRSINELDLWYSLNFMYLFSWLYLPTFISKTTIVSEKSIVLTFSHAKAYGNKFDLAVR